MLVIEVELLTGRYAAASVSDRDVVEWPPHPARLFSAAVAASGPTAKRSAADTAALEGLQNLPPPEVHASNLSDSEARGRRTVRATYVPVNDPAVSWSVESFDAFRSLQTGGSKAEHKKWQATLDKALHLKGGASDSDLKLARSVFPTGRSRQQRTFPCFLPDVPRVFFVWPEASVPKELAAGISNLLSRVAALGHSSSLVRCGLVETPSTDVEVLFASASGEQTLRWVGPDQLRRLDDAFKQHEGTKPRVLPAIPVRYGFKPETSALPVSTSLFEDHGWLILDGVLGERNESRRFAATRCVDIAKALHGALLSYAPTQPARQILTGKIDGKPTQAAHLAILPLPDVGHPYAHGHVMGVGLVLPKATTTEERQYVVKALVCWLEAGGQLTLTGGAVWQMKHVEWPDARALQPPTWTRPARSWATVTPIALDKNPGALGRGAGAKAKESAASAEQSIADACVNIGLPRPTHVEISFSPFVSGSVHARQFDPFPREPGRIRRVKVHAKLTFSEPVLGPVILGAGRFFGLGLCRPLNGDN